MAALLYKVDLKDLAATACTARSVLRYKLYKSKFHLQLFLLFMGHLITTHETFYMRISYKALLLLLVISVSFGSCQKEDVEMSASEVSGCDPKRKTVKVANGVEGHVWFNSAIQEYAIYVSVAGTYDTQYVGVPCALPEEFKKDGLQVVLSGAYMDYGSQPAGAMAGQTYYYLKLSNIREKL